MTSKKRVARRKQPQTERMIPVVQGEIIDVVDEPMPGVVRVTEIETTRVTLPNSDDDEGGVKKRNRRSSQQEGTDAVGSKGAKLMAATNERPVRVPPMPDTDGEALPHRSDIRTSNLLTVPT